MFWSLRKELLVSYSGSYTIAKIYMTRTERWNGWIAMIDVQRDMELHMELHIGVCCDVQSVRAVLGVRYSV